MIQPKTNSTLDSTSQFDLLVIKPTLIPHLFVTGAIFSEPMRKPSPKGLLVYQPPIIILFVLGEAGTPRPGTPSSIHSGELPAARVRSTMHLCLP